MDAVKSFYHTGKLAIDLSADFRLINSAVYTRWYGLEHAAPELLQVARYGLCELLPENMPGRPTYRCAGLLPDQR